MSTQNLTKDEEKALIGLLYNHITLGTTLEVFGELNQNGVQRIDVLRSALTTLLKKYDLARKLTKETYLLLGMKDFVDTETLKQLSENEDNKHLQLRAQYFIQKK